jgi:hypothetical protein
VNSRHVGMELLQHGFALAWFRRDDGNDMDHDWLTPFDLTPLPRARAAVKKCRRGGCRAIRGLPLAKARRAFFE